jgi:hypothetical protein
MTAAYFVARGDQHAGCASVIAADGRVWNNVRIDWTIAGALQLSDTYTTDSWYLGLFAWVFIFAVIGYGTYIVDGLVRRVGRKLKIDSAS